MAPPRGGPVFVCPQARGDAQHAWRTLRPWRWKPNTAEENPCRPQHHSLNQAMSTFWIRPTRTR